MLVRQAHTHPEWQDSDVDLWVTAAGGQTTVTGVGPARVSELATPGWARFIGVRPATAAPAFRSASRGSAPTVSRGETTGAPAWVVDATSTGADGAALRYRVEYEPFSGRLVAISCSRQTATRPQAYRSTVVLL